MKKRILSMMLIFTIVLCTMPAVFAADNDNSILTDYYWYYDIQDYQILSFEEDGTIDFYGVYGGLYEPSSNRTFTSDELILDEFEEEYYPNARYTFDGTTLTFSGYYDNCVLDLYDKKTNPASIRDRFVADKIAEYDGNTYLYESDWVYSGAPSDNAMYLVRLGRKDKNVSKDSPFTDVKGSDYYSKAVLWAVGNGITQGTSTTTFSPKDDCTRAQIVTFLWRASGSPKLTSMKNPFSDVKKGTYYYDAVLWAVKNGITTGTSATTFSPDDNCTRGQAVTFLHRTAGTTKPATKKNPFSDVKNKSFYYDAVLWAVGEDITTGTDATHFAPNDSCTRAQIVTFLYRYMN